MAAEHGGRTQERDMTNAGRTLRWLFVLQALVRSAP